VLVLLSRVCDGRDGVAWPVWRIESASRSVVDIFRLNTGFRLLHGTRYRSKDYGGARRRQDQGLTSQAA